MTEYRPPVCITCHGPREIESETPGERKYAPCGECGAVGVMPALDAGVRNVNQQLRNLKKCPAVRRKRQ